jgi:hypothetical protein
MNIQSILVLILIAALALLALRRMKKHGMCAGCSSKGSGSCSGNCASCPMRFAEKKDLNKKD